MGPIHSERDLASGFLVEAREQEVTPPGSISFLALLLFIELLYVLFYHRKNISDTSSIWNVCCNFLTNFGNFSMSGVDSLCLNCDLKWFSCFFWQTSAVCGCKSIYLAFWFLKKVYFIRLFYWEIIGLLNFRLEMLSYLDRLLVLCSCIFVPLLLGLHYWQINLSFSFGSHRHAENYLIS